ncbi:hypothetical protein ACN1C3_26850, partial [Pseudomonas sp. H11T01]|uniref:hypothetical protein n=1 Tax=Pseudomonas sp. H11T01 TaxID=3402749 RepID=UPI003ACA53F3
WKQCPLAAIFTLDIAHKKNARILRCGHFLEPESRLLGFHTICEGAVFLPAVSAALPVYCPTK